MDAARDLSQLGKENPHPPSYPDLADQLSFDSVFDWPAYLNDTEPLDKPSSHHRAHHLEKLITEIHPLIDSLESHRFFKMGTSFGGDDEAVTASDYSGHPSPPDLYREEGSTSPSDHSGSNLPDRFEDPQPRTSGSLRDYRAHDDKWTYPQTDPTKGLYAQGYPPLLRVPDVRLVPYYDQASPGLKRRRSDKAPDKRSRHLPDPAHTADVRKSGACIPCRVSKIRCHDHGVCPTCRKAFPENSHLVCMRLNPSETWPVISKVPDIWSKHSSKEIRFHSSPRFFIGKPREISIFFSRDSNSPPLRASVQAYRWNDEKDDGKLEKAAFPRECVPSHATLQMWAENQIRLERTSDFRSAVHRFLLAYSQDGHGLPKHALVSKVHKMACFFRIWRTASYWCRDPTGKIVNLPLSVQAELRNIVLQGLHLLEYDILKELDEYVTPTGTPKPQDKLAIWVCLWQLMLIYRDLTAACRSALKHSDPSDPQTVVMQARYKTLTDSFFPLITIFYHYQFRTKKSLELSLDWSKTSARTCQSKSIHRAVEKLLETRKTFLNSVQTSDNEIDRLLSIFVVNHEIKKLNSRSRTPKSSKSKGQRGGDDCDDDA